jgi:hypothetical protein
MDRVQADLERISKKVYAERRLASARKRRLRKKLSKRIEGLFIDYCFRHYGKTLDTLFYATYSEAISDLLSDSNPFLVGTYAR